MRQQIFDRLFARMAADERVFLATADMGINLVERFQQTFPKRYVNVGIAEQNLIGVGAGLCNAGFRPFLYTISNFLIHRCFEQLRNDVALHGYPVVLLGTSTGFDNAPLGPTHHVVDDWGCLSGISGIDIYCPSGLDYADSLVDRLIEIGRPAYVRIPKGQFETPGGGSDAVLVQGRDPRLLLISYGSSVQQCLAAAEAREDVSVLILNCLRPLDEPTVVDSLRSHERVWTVEDHLPQSGLYAAVCRLIAQHRLSIPIDGLGPWGGYDLTVGRSDSFYHQRNGTDTESILRSLAIELTC